MKTLKDLKEAMSKDEELKKKFMSLKSKEDAVNLAHDMGYDINLEELESDEEINEDLLESVAGGKMVETESKEVRVVDVGKGGETKVSNNADVNKVEARFKRLEESYRR